MDALLDWHSDSDFAAIWRGYVLHSLLFYRQNNLRDFKELVRLGGGETPKTRPTDPILQGLLRHERYWGSLRLSDASIACFEQAAPDNPWRFFLSGMAHEMKRRYARAIGLQERAIALRPDWAWPWILKGICRWYMADFSGSVEDFEKAARLDPKSEYPLLFAARAKADLRDRSLVKDLDRALKLSPRSGFGLSWRGRAMFVLKRTPEALEDLKRSIRALPDYDRGYSWLGVSYVEQGKWAQGSALLRKARKLNPYYPTTLYPLARACLKLGKLDEAGRVLQEAAAIDRHGVWVEHRISMSHPNPACLRSIEDLNVYLAKRPRAAWALAWRGQTELLLQNYWKALADLNEALRLAPRDPWARTWRGEALRRLGFFEKAIEDFDKAKGIAWVRAGKGFSLLSLGKPREALGLLEGSGECAPISGWKAEANYQLGRFRRAAEHWERALELHPQDHWVYGRLWRARARLGDWRGAREALAALSADGGSRSDRAWALLGWAESRLGKKAEAAAAFKRALALNPASELALNSGKLGLKDVLRLADAERGSLKPDIGDPLAAIEEASRALDNSLDPYDARALLLREEARKRCDATI